MNEIVHLTNFENMKTYTVKATVLFIMHIEVSDFIREQLQHHRTNLQL